MVKIRKKYKNIEMERKINKTMLKCKICLHTSSLSKYISEVIFHRPEKGRPGTCGS